LYEDAAGDDTVEAIVGAIHEGFDYEYILDRARAEPMDDTHISLQLSYILSPTAEEEDC
jgi:hypothetical protein